MFYLRPFSLGLEASILERNLSRQGDGRSYLRKTGQTTFPFITKRNGIVSTLSGRFVHLLNFYGRLREVAITLPQSQPL